MAFTAFCSIGKREAKKVGTGWGDQTCENHPPRLARFRATATVERYSRLDEGVSSFLWSLMRQKSRLDDDDESVISILVVVS